MPGMSGFDVCRELRAQAKFAPCADFDADQPGRHAVGATRLQRGRHGLHIEGNQSDVAGGARQVPGARQRDSGPTAGERGAGTLSGVLRSADGIAQPATIAADPGTAGGMGQSTAPRDRRADDRCRQFLAHQRYPGSGGWRQPAEGDRPSPATVPAGHGAHAAERRCAERHQRLGGAHRRRRIRARAAGRGHDRQRPGRGAARAARLGTAFRVCAAGDTAVGDHRRQHVSGRCADAPKP